MKLTRSHSLILTSILGFFVLAAPGFAFAQTSFMQDLLYSLVTNITGMFLGFGGMILNYGINDFLLGFGNTFNTTGIGVAVDTTWSTIRDFVNLTFIFGLVYIGFKMILNSNDSQTKRWLASLILAALLINFSLFISKSIIEVSNQFAAQIIQSGFTMYTDQADGLQKVDMAGTLQDKLGITTIWQSTRSGNNNMPAKVNGDNGYGYIFGVGILFLVTGFVYAAGGILLIIRFAVLNFYMILSPVLFLGWILPPLSGTLDKYWKQFLSKCFFAPVYILMLYFSFQVLNGLGAQSGGGSSKFNPNGGTWSGTFGNVGSDVIANGQSTIPYFILTCFFLVGSLIIAQRMGTEGANKAMSVGKNIQKSVQKGVVRGTGAVTLGAGARAAQATVGQGSRALADNKGLQAWAAKSKLGAATLKSARYGADASFDVRNVGGLGKKTGLGTSKGGYDTRIKNKNKKDEEFLKNLDNADMNDPKNKEKAAMRQAEIEAEAEAKAKISNAKLAEHEESKDKTSVILNREIDELGKNIESLTKELAEKEADGTRTPQEIEAAKRRLEIHKERLAQKTSTATLVGQREKQEQDIARLKLEEVDQSKDAQQRAQIREKRQQAEAGLVQTEKALEDEAKTLATEIKNAQTMKTTAGTTAFAEVKYANQITFIKRRKKEGTIGFNPVAAASAENLEKKFGKDAAEFAKKSKDSKDEENLLKQLKKKMNDDKSSGEKESGDEDKS